jgi:hypothetical protein
MADFGFVAAQAITGETISRFRMPTLRMNGNGIPFLDMRPASPENVEWQRAMLRLDAAQMRVNTARERGKRKPKGGLDDEAAMDKALEIMDIARERDLSCYPELIVTGWGLEYRGPEDVELAFKGSKKFKAGKPQDGPMMDAVGPVDFSPENVRDFLRAIWTRSVDDFDALRFYAKDPENYRGQGALDGVDVEALSGNSPSG